LFPFGRTPTSPSTTLRLLLNDEGTQLAFGSRLTGNAVVMQQPQPCAIPLTNVMPPSGTSSKIRRVPIPDALFPMQEVRPPAPSCDDRK
jgi:hypothetical protein